MAKTTTWLPPAVAHAWVDVHSKDGWEMVDTTLATNLPSGRFWFGRGTGRHLSYGEQNQQDVIYNEIMAWTTK